MTKTNLTLTEDIIKKKLKLKGISITFFNVSFTTTSFIRLRCNHYVDISLPSDLLLSTSKLPIKKHLEFLMEDLKDAVKTLKSKVQKEGK